MQTKEQPIAKDETIAFYDAVGPEYAKKRITDPLFYKDEFKIFKELIKGKKESAKDKKVIDIACGTGRDTPFFLKEKMDYLGIDASLAMLGFAKKANSEARYHLMNFYTLNLPQNSFDGFWAAAALLHVPKPRLPDVLWQIDGAVKRGAIGFISVKERTGMVNEGIENEPQFGSSRRYFSYYEQEEFERVLMPLGFNILKSYKKPEADPKRPHWLCFFVRKV